MKFFKITFENGYTMDTGFNGTLEEAKEYYLNKFFYLREDQYPVRATIVQEYV
jgi:hypothetical protein